MIAVATAVPIAYLMLTGRRRGMAHIGQTRSVFHCRRADRRRKCRSGDSSDEVSSRTLMRRPHGWKNPVVAYTDRIGRLQLQANSIHLTLLQLVLETAHFTTPQRIRSDGRARSLSIPSIWLDYNCRPIRFINPVLQSVRATAIDSNGFGPAQMGMTKCASYSGIMEKNSTGSSQ